MKGILHNIAEDLGIPEDAPRYGMKLAKFKRELEKRDDPFLLDGEKDIISRFEKLLESHARFSEYLRDDNK